MDLTYTYEEAQYREGVQRFVSKVLTPLVNDKYDFSRTLTREEVASFRADVQGYEIATEAPLDENGKLDLICFGIFIEEISKLNPVLASLCTMVFFPVWDLGALLQGPQKENYAHMFAPGEIVAMGMSEPNAGSHLAGLQTTARKEADGSWVLNGSKIWTSNAAIAAGLIVAARNLESGLISLFILDRKRAPYDPRPIPKLGWSGIAFYEVGFDEVRLEPDAELTPGKGGLKTALSFIEEARIKMMFMAVGIAQASLELAVDYAKVRTQFGKPIGSFQLVQGMLADMAIETELSRLMAYKVASEFKSGLRDRKTVSMAKAYCCEAATRVASTGVQVHGAIGITKECLAERYFRDARLLTIPDGTTEIHKLVIGRELTGFNAIG